MKFTIIFINLFLFSLLVTADAQLKKFTKLYVWEGNLTAQMEIRQVVPVTSENLCILVAGQMEWSRLFCYFNNECLLTSLMVVEENTTGVNTVKCYSKIRKQEVISTTEIPKTTAAASTTAVATTTAAPTTTTTSTTTPVPTTTTTSTTTPVPTTTTTSTTTPVPTTTTTSSTTPAPTRPAMIDSNFFLTPKLSYANAVNYCKNNNGSCYIPKTEEEHKFYTAKVQNPPDSFAWYPVNDIAIEGKPMYEDGTVYGQGPYTPLPNAGYANGATKDCTGVNPQGLIGWGGCTGYSFLMLCLKN